MTTTQAVAAFLSKEVYNDQFIGDTFGLPGQSQTRFEVIDVTPNDLPSGYYGAVIKDTDHMPYGYVKGL